MEALKEELPMFDELTVIPFSAVTDEGVAKIRAIIEEVSEEETEESK